ncbi:hypothetical protein [Blastococcus sp. VKM Ac-2987]|uniref:hypothetical protein n=1 Tax=Blastococcus sp. VKM Ac-2987 TaxID=3004141 RepID=UPI0022ABBF4B|nr:hypothetical protein [Blastococcus sp. VKM Ac-2987]MCZ2860534.1 hypothetical protein [Blastococcus sp. VKM Ac-2987]
MTSPPDSPAPGNLTVPPLFDWDVLASVVGLVAVLAVVALFALSARPGASGRAEWQQLLAARSRVPHDPEDLRAER